MAPVKPERLLVPRKNGKYLFNIWQANIDQLKREIESNDTEAMKSTMQKLEEQLMQIGQAVYQQQQQQGGAQGANPGAQQQGGQQQQAKDGDVVDAEIVDDDK